MDILRSQDQRNYDWSSDDFIREAKAIIKRVASDSNPIKKVGTLLFEFFVDDQDGVILKKGFRGVEITPSVRLGKKDEVTVRVRAKVSGETGEDELDVSEIFQSLLTADPKLEVVPTGGSLGKKIEWNDPDSDWMVIFQCPNLRTTVLGLETVLEEAKQKREREQEH